MTNQDYYTSRQAMLMQVKQLCFAAIDANLYLDTHPCDRDAIAYFNQMTEACRNARAAYEAQFGPLSAAGANDVAYWSWVNDPWPWEGGSY